MKFLQPLFGWLRVRTPRPPYDEQHYWDRIYRETRGRVIEWAEMSIPELETYKWGGAEGDFLMRNKKEGRLEEHLGKDDSVLVLGCGNSAMGDDLRTSGWRGKITSVDFAEECVQLCKLRADAKGLEDMEFLTADVRALHDQLPPSSFDVALDKGCLDAIFSSAGSDESVRATKASVFKLLKPGGRWMCLMNGGILGAIPPTNFVLPLVDDSRWKSVEVRRLAPALSGIYLFVWTKGQEVAPAAAQRKKGGGKSGRYGGRQRGGRPGRQ